MGIEVYLRGDITPVTSDLQFHEAMRRIEVAAAQGMMFAVLNADEDEAEAFQIINVNRIRQVDE